MRRRTKAREYALQLLYQVDISRSEAAQAIEAFWTYHRVPTDVREFADLLIRGTLEHLTRIDEMIAARANNWDIARMAVVDRNILRLGVYELLHMHDVPPKVCLNEAVELAKRFGDEESSRFVNGILDAIHKQYVSRPVDPTAPEAAPSGSPQDDLS